MTTHRDAIAITFAAFAFLLLFGLPFALAVWRTLAGRRQQGEKLNEL